MKLSPREIDHLELAQCGLLAQRRLARGLKLNYPEAVALISSQMQERIRDGDSIQTLMTKGKRLGSPISSSTARVFKFVEISQNSV